MTRILPDFLRFYRLDRRAALSLLHHDFERYAEGMVRLKAEESLDRYQTSALAFDSSSSGAQQYLRSLQRQAKGEDHKPMGQRDKSGMPVAWTRSLLADFAQER